MLLLSVAATMILAGVSPAKAQTSDAVYFVPSLYPKSPNAASFTKYGDYQVNLFTGIPDISIPLYTIEAGGLKLPISLSYHASGNKVTDVASWVGLGWSIPGGGAVSRRVMGGPDDGTYGYLTTYVHNPAHLNMYADSDMLYVDRIANGLNDGRPDIYSYDFPGHSGKFFFNGANHFRPVIVPCAPVNIKYTYVAPSGSTVKALTNFTLTDENGDLFKFGDSATEMTETSGAGNNPGTPFASSWLLENMVSQNRRDTISFTYGTDNISYPDVTSQMIAITDGVSGPDNIYHPNISQVNTSSTVSSVVEKPIQQINFKNGKVVFDWDGAYRSDLYGGYGLSDIKVYGYNYSTKTMQVLKTIKFYKSYFGTTGANNLRLRLDSIQVLDEAGAIVQHYRFGYNNSIVLPQYSSYAKDYWGYYNGKDIGNTLTSLIPSQTVPYNGGTTQIGGTVAHNRDSDSLHMQAYMLDTIYYPTGGHTIFTYQTNQYLNGLGALRIAGGLRIKSISSYDGISSTPMVKTYVYAAADSNFFLNYHYYAAPVQVHRYYTINFSMYNAWDFCNVTNYVSNPTIDLEPWDAGPVVYPSVSEYYGTPGNNVGYSTYLYNFESDDTQDASMVGTPIVTSYYYNRGKLLNKSDYLRTGGGSYQLVKSVSNTYRAFPETQYLNVGFVARKIYSNEGGGGLNNNYPILSEQSTFYTPTDVGSYIYDNYWIYSTDNYLTATTTQDYDMNNPSNYTTSTDTYVYGDTTHLQVARTIHTDSKGNTHVTANKYPFDYLVGSTTNNAVLDSMISQHMYASVVEKWDTLKNVATSVNAVTHGQLNQYQYGQMAGAVVPYKISTLSVATPLTNFVPASVESGVLTGDSRYVQMISFDLYDSNNNLKQYTPRNATPTSVIWDYQNYLPIAQVKNSVNTTSPTTIAYTSFEATGKGNWSFSGTPVFNPTAPTGSMVYSLSAGSISSPALDNTKSYVLSYWSNSGPATVFYGSSISGTALQSVNGWTYYEHQLPTAGSGSSITISGSTLIDELRLYPSAAQMTTYAYAPEGITAIADTKGSIGHFEYDYFERLKNLKDWAGNIVKNYGYHTYDQAVANQVQTASFTRTTCPGGTTPGSLSYTVPAAKYYSSTQASANADAIYDMNLNGQIKANTNCACAVATTSFTLSNTTGISGFQATFSGVASPYNFPSSGSTIVQVPTGTYTTISVGPVGSATHTFTLGTYPAQSGVHSASWSSVTVSSSSGQTSISIH